MAASKLAHDLLDGSLISNVVDQRRLLFYVWLEWRRGAMEGTEESQGGGGTAKLVLYITTKMPRCP